MANIDIRRKHSRPLKEARSAIERVAEHIAEKFDVDARPSDAIALAVRARAPIFVHEDVIDEVAAN